MPGLAWGRTLKPLWKSVHFESVSGVEVSASMMTYPRYLITLSYEVLRAETAYAELQQLLGFFNQRRGSADDFLWLDQDDNQLGGTTFGVGDGATKIFQISRDRGGFREPVTDFVGAPVISVGGSAVSTGYTVSKGRVTFGTAPANGSAITATGQFYKRVRFHRDEQEFEQFLHDLWSAKKVELITRKVR